MNLIFNKEGRDGIDEMRKYFAQIHGSLLFSQVQIDVEVAQEELAKHVSTSVITKAITHYQSALFEKEDANDEEKQLDEFVYRVQHAVTLFAYKEFASNNDATHTTTGRVSRSDKDSDEFNLRLIQQDDNALFKKSYRAIDRLIKYIDDISLSEWLASDQYKRTKDVLLWNADLFDEFYAIDKSRYMFQLLLPVIRTVQLQYITSRLGTDVFEALLAKVKVNDLSDTDDATLFRLCAAAITNLSMAIAYQKHPIELFPESLGKQLWSAGNGAAAISIRSKLSADLFALGKNDLEALDAELLQREAGDETVADDAVVDIHIRASEDNKYMRV